MKKTRGRGQKPVSILSADDAAALIKDRDCVWFGGSGGGHAVPERMIDAVRDRYAKTSTPRDLSIVGTVAIGDWETLGFNKLDAPGLLRRVMASGLNNCPKLGELALADKIEAYTVPQGVLAQLSRDTAGGRPGTLTKVGLGTFADPRNEGCRQSPSTPNDFVKLVDVDGEEFLLYRSFPIDVAIIRGTTADERGNVSMEDEAFIGENFSIAAAARRSGGIVIAQVQRLAAGGSLNPREVKVPGILVDYVVIDENQKQTYQTPFNPAYAGKMRIPEAAIPPIPFDIRKVIARRAAMELAPGAIVNIGFGVSNGIAPVAAEEGIHRDVTMTAEQGIIGGLPAVGKDAGAGLNYDMLAPQPDQFDFYDGGGLDMAFLSFAEIDEQGNVNVSRFGKSIIGPGGFVNISTGARKIVFSGTLTTGGLKVSPDGVGGLALEKDGAVTKFVKRVQQITFNGDYARKRKQEVVFITERAVFKLLPEGVTLVEAAPGISVERDIVARVGFKVRVAPDLKEMDARIFRNEPMGFAKDFWSKSESGSAAGGAKVRRTEGAPA